MTTRILSLLLLLTALSVSAQTNKTPYCCRYPLRTFASGKTVNLTPLFQWWIGHGGQNDDQPANTADYVDPQRPLTAWKRITGIRTAEWDGAWVVNAEVSASPGSRTNEWIILLHPPAVEEQQYYNLQALVAQDTEQITSDARAQEDDLKAAKRADARAARDASDFSKSVRMYSHDYARQAAQYRRDAAAALSDQKLREQARAQTQQDLDKLPSSDNLYQLDCFARELGRNRKGQLIFDAGAADGYSQ